MYVIKYMVNYECSREYFQGIWGPFNSTENAADFIRNEADKLGVKVAENIFGNEIYALVGKDIKQPIRFAIVSNVC